MDEGYPVETYRELEEEFHGLALRRPMRVARFEDGTELEYAVTSVATGGEATIRLVVERFVGGGFAGQVYRVRVLEVLPGPGAVPGIEPGQVCAMKILIPPGAFSRLFRNALYWVGFQGPFQLQVNPAAARAGALWQKFIRRGARICFGDEAAVVDVFGTFADPVMGSCGELSEWIDGRTWRLEADARIDLLKRWSKGKEVDPQALGSPEYRAKHEFMSKFVELLHNMGAHEFARQYEWSTWKSQPNCLKRLGQDESPTEGLVAVDFRAGLALLPFLPMSPGDFKLIAQGVRRGSLVQFDRGDVGKLEQFVEQHGSEFADMRHSLDELKENERVYRDSLPDVTHNHVRLLYSRQLWSTIREGLVTGWKVRNLVDSAHEAELRASKTRCLLFYLLGALPFLGRFLRRMWGQQQWRSHYLATFTSWAYFRRAVRGKCTENVIEWLRAGRVADGRALEMARSVWRCSSHLPLSILPAGLHRSLTDWRYALNRLGHLIVRPVRLYFDPALRAEWLRQMVTEGRSKHLLSEEDGEVILSQIDEPFIQKYLQSLAVHICTLPVTQIVSVVVAVIYVAMHPEMPRAQAYAIGLGIVALFQVVPISPGSLVRGLYVVYLVIRDRNFRDYNIAVFLGFFKYVGYLAFPIQMTYRYPALAAFMAGHWATEAVHIIPVFGERGALLEHRVFCLFYNRPLTIRRRMRIRGEIRATLDPRYWHIVPCAMIGGAILGLADWSHFRISGEPPGLAQVWALALLVPVVSGALVTLAAGGAGLGRRVIGGVICGLAVGVLYTVASAIIGYGAVGGGDIVVRGVWRAFAFAMVSGVGVLLTEVSLPEPSR